MLKKIMNQILTTGQKKSNGIYSKSWDKKAKRFRRSQPLLMSTSVRPILMNELNRRVYASELIDTQKGFGLPYVLDRINRSFKADLVANDMKELALCLPIMKNFINQISKVYNKQPIRKFYNEKGLQIVDEIPEYGDKSRYEANPNLVKIFEEAFYNQHNHTTFKSFEKQVNLLKTVIVKANWEESEKRIELIAIPNDRIAVEVDEDTLKVEEFIFCKKDVEQADGLVIAQTYQETQSWTIDTYTKFATKLADMKETPNNTPQKTRELFGGENIGSGFAPFSVLKHDFSTTDFWNVEDWDINELIKNLNVAFTELRYLIRYGSFGLKWVKDLDVSNVSSMDLKGMISLKTQGKTGDVDTSAIGEFSNRGDIQAVVNGIVFIAKILYDSYGVALDSLVSTNSMSSAESKMFDSYKQYELVRDSQEIWQLNEEIIFKNMCSVYERENKGSIPKGVKIMIDFADLPMESVNKAKENNNMQVLIQNNIKTVIDWMRKENPDLSQEEAKTLIETNKDYNDSMQDFPEDGEAGNSFGKKGALDKKSKLDKMEKAKIKNKN